MGVGTSHSQFGCHLARHIPFIAYLSRSLRTVSRNTGSILWRERVYLETDTVSVFGAALFETLQQPDGIDRKLIGGIAQSARIL